MLCRTLTSRPTKSPSTTMNQMLKRRRAAVTITLEQLPSKSYSIKKKTGKKIRNGLLKILSHNMHLNYNKRAIATVSRCIGSVISSHISQTFLA